MSVMDRTLPWWTWPGQLLGHVSPTLGWTVRRDVALVARLPGAVWWPVAALAVLVPFALLRLGIEEVYTESLVFVVLMLALGLLAPTLGVLLVVGYAFIDLVHSAGDFGLLGLGMLGRAVSWGLLWLLVVEIPSVAIATRRVVEGWLRDGVLRLGAAAAAGVAAGLLVWIWTLAAAILIRPAFVWGPYRTPLYAAIGPLQERGILLAVLAGVVAAGVAAAHLRLRTTDGVADPPAPAVERLARPVRLVVRFGVTLLLLGGMISVAMDVLILLAGLVAAHLVAIGMARAGPVTRWVAAVPRLVRFLVGFVVVLRVGVLIHDRWFWLRPFGGSEFFPVVVSVAVGMIIYAALLAPSREHARPMAPGRAAGLLVVLAAGHLLLMPGVALAHDCSGMSDCYSTAAAAAAGAAGAAAAAIGALFRRDPPGPPPPEPIPYRPTPEWTPPPPPELEEFQWDAGPPEPRPRPREKESIRRARRSTDLLRTGRRGHRTGSAWRRRGRSGGLTSEAQSLMDIPGRMVGELLDWLYDTYNRAAGSLGQDPPRDDYTEVAVVEAPAVPRVVPEDGDPPELVDAAQALLRDGLILKALLDAAIVSLDRNGGALDAGDTGWAVRQARVVEYYKTEAGRFMPVVADALDAYLDTVVAVTGDETVRVTEDEVRAHIDRLRDEGFTPDERYAARILGVPDDRIEEVRASWVDVDPAMVAGPVLPPLREAASALRDLGGALSEGPYEGEAGSAPP